jgi:hypothetical protein
MKYNEVEMEILRFDVEDIITTSSDLDEGEGGD